MAAMTAKKPCSKCSKCGAVTTCDGCQQSFCTKHFVEHRQELTQQMDSINRDHELFLHEAQDQKVSQHPFFKRIDAWERKAINKIQAAAEAARQDLSRLLDRTKNDIKPSIGRLSNELQLSQKSDDFTENDLQRWVEQLKDLRKRLEMPSTIVINNEEDSATCIHLIKVNDRQQSVHIRSSIPVIIRSTSEQRIQSAKQSISMSNETFSDVDGKATLSEDGRLVTSGLASILSQPIIYGSNRYSSGKHHVRFRIEKMSEARIFFGIIRSIENISRTIHGQNNNSSLYGWWDLNEAVINGRAQTTKYRNLMISGDELVLIIDCDNKLIQLQHQRTKRLPQISIDLEKCPLPWKIAIRLTSVGDCVRILN